MFFSLKNTFKLSITILFKIVMHVTLTVIKIKLKEKTLRSKDSDVVIYCEKSLNTKRLF